MAASQRSSPKIRTMATGCVQLNEHRIATRPQCRHRSGTMPRDGVETTVQTCRRRMRRSKHTSTRDFMVHKPRFVFNHMLEWLLRSETVPKRESKGCGCATNDLALRFDSQGSQVSQPRWRRRRCSTGMSASSREGRTPSSMSVKLLALKKSRSSPRNTRNSSMKASGWPPSRSRRSIRRSVATRSSGPALRCSLFWMVCLISCAAAPPRPGAGQLRVTGEGWRTGARLLHKTTTRGARRNSTHGPKHHIKTACADTTRTNSVSHGEAYHKHDSINVIQGSCNRQRVHSCLSVVPAHDFYKVSE